jgi:hypothetical protein
VGRAELTVDDGGAVMVTDGGDGSFSGSTYTTHGGLGFHRIKRERTGKRWRLAHRKGRIGGGATHRGSTPVREGWRQWFVELLRSVGVLLDLPGKKEGG